GIEWYQVQDLRLLDFFYRQFVVPLDETLIAHGLAYTRPCRIRFTYVASYTQPLDGMRLDDISVTGDKPSMKPSGYVLLAEDCATPNRAIDPGETVTVGLALTNAGTRPTQHLTARLRAAGGVVNPSEPQIYGQLIPGGKSETRPFTFQAAGL